MPFAVIFVIFVLFVLIVRFGSGGADRNALLTRGTFAHGLILEASATSTEATYAGQRFERRALTLDVEIPGKEPYEIQATPMIPRICEALPGAALDLRVDPMNRKNIAIVGPAGASGWIAAGASIPGQTWAPTRLGQGLPRGCGWLIVVAVGMSLLLASVLSIVNGSTSREPSAPTHVKPTKPSPSPRTRSTPRSSHPH